jgi:hypothetical protein
VKFTDLSVKALSVSAGQRTFFDDTFPGFGVRVTPRSKSFVVLVRRNNATRWETLGRYPEPSHYPKLRNQKTAKPKKKIGSRSLLLSYDQRRRAWPLSAR